MGRFHKFFSVDNAVFGKMEDVGGCNGSGIAFSKTLDQMFKRAHATKCYYGNMYNVGNRVNHLQIVPRSGTVSVY